MGVDVTLARIVQEGTSPRRRSTTTVAVLLDDGDVLARVLPRSGLPMLARVDPYGDVVLSSSEMEQLLDELHVLVSRSARSDVVVLDRVVALAERCLRDPGAELRFEGD
ncbi:hypothetical protein H1Q78_04140 [Cellulosimicrobium cellulans]|uniref:hypothetical protein n=1 Tax=Cellulosimicrobium cellulans TaxID=1710 RepID=UPI001ED9D552|nr:hypothetical protein [Cellulosimicrobium cellulans]UKJ64616.1 hypothetical protein H1Q78_04140 [Cellulosimicrobium cellulans]